MRAFEFNKISGAVLFALLAMFGARTVSNIIFAPVTPDKPGYKIEVEEERAPGQNKDAAPAPTLAQLLSAANEDEGKKHAKKCKSCHSFNEGGPVVKGPNLYAIVGRRSGAVAGYSYSRALASKGPWNYEALDAFIANPKRFAPGTTMTYAGLKKAAQRADLIVYLRGLSAHPVPLPQDEPAASAPDAPAASDSAESAPVEGSPASGGPDETNAITP